MRGSKQDLPVAFDGGEVVIRQADWSDLTVSIESFPQGLDTAPIFRGLPDDRCQCPHWGVVTSGSMSVNYPDHDETASTGDVFYMPPGHVPTFEVGTQLIMFSPTEELKATNEAIERNLQALQGT